MSDAKQYRPLALGDIRQAGDESKLKRNKRWRPIMPANVGRPITLRHIKDGFEFRRPVTS
ncbi:MAG: hypothetical protein KF715_08560 [Candidatus Didemnitutus sp.]|nr:hypothetical protein [Candidatus Didemnitutus sp.]